MSERICKLSFCQGKCYLLSQIDSQAQNGADPAPGVSDSCGPYWDKNQWTSYIGRVKDLAKSGCLNPNEVSKHADSVTKEKEARGELR